jgi:hypothetical protein
MYNPTIREISSINRSRCDRWHENMEPWTGADWSNAIRLKFNATSREFGFQERLA